MYDYKNKAMNKDVFVNYMLSKTIPMFEYAGLPVPIAELEKLLQKNGYAFLFEHEGAVIAACGGFCGNLDEYGRHTQITINIPSINLNKTFDLKNGVVIHNDTMKQGLLPLFERTGALLAENDINFVLLGYSVRTNKLISASDDKTKQSAEKYIEKVVAGELAIVGENELFEGVKVHNSAMSGNAQFSSLIQYSQYLKSVLMNELGITTQESFHKKANLLQDEVEHAKELSFPLVYDMLQCRKKGMKEIYEKFGVKCTVTFGSVWGIKYCKYCEKGEEKMLLSEYMQGGSLWEAIKENCEGMAIQQIIASFDTKKLDRQTELLYGERELFNKYVGVDVGEMGSLIALTHAQKWANLEELKNVKIGTGEVETKTIARKTDNTKNKEGENTNKISVDNVDAMIEESGMNSTEVENTSTSDTVEEIRTIQDFSNVEQDLTRASKMAIVNVLLLDVAEFITINVY